MLDGWRDDYATAYCPETRSTRRDPRRSAVAALAGWMTRTRARKCRMSVQIARLSFIGHTTDSLWSVDLFRCESIVLRSYWVLVVMDQFTRRLVGVGVQRGTVIGADLCRMFNAAIHERGAPRHLSTDHDPLFEAHRWTANLRILEIVEIKT